MGFGDKFKDLTQQAKDRVAENREKIQEAVDAAAVAANEKTHGKYANKIMKVNEKTGSALDKFSAGAQGGDGTDAEDAAGAQASDDAPVAQAPQDSTPPSFADDAPVAQPPLDSTPPSFADDAPAPAPAPAASTASMTDEPSPDGPKFDD